ncbi:oxysterols receptor LXR-alpha-like [Anneissia japonica]|uniref:oxysterols receptor LXR-alpha-like n=1 Tax=Anneissia japonica TaxID=1529436 RepID=UPI0014258945|nr:oxysterols receptor LXR-alpha-like [Anneissia japonica]
MHSNPWSGPKHYFVPMRKYLNWLTSHNSESLKMPLSERSSPTASSIRSKSPISNAVAPPFKRARFEKMSVDYTKQKCLVCGDKASGLHYTVISCESCKSFFGRKIKSKAKFTCEANGNCVMDLYTRRHCPACRLKKCLDVGMKPERVWDEKRLETRKPLERKNKKKQTQQQPLQQQPQPQQQTSPPQPSQGPVNPLLPVTDEKSPKLLPYQEELVRCLEKAKDAAKASNKVHQPSGRFDEILERMKTSLDLGSRSSNGNSCFGIKGFPFNGCKPEDKGMRLPNAQSCPLNLSVSGEDGIINDVDVTNIIPPGFNNFNGHHQPAIPVKQEVIGHTEINFDMSSPADYDANMPTAMRGHPDSLLYNMTLMGCVIRQTVAFTKGIPMFRDLTYEDQAVLIKNAILEVLILRCAECYNPEKNAVVDDITGSEWSYDAMMSSGFGTSAEPTLKFVQAVNAMNLTKEEYALLQAIAIISPDRPDLGQKEKIEEIQRPMVITLQNLCKITHPDDKLLFAKLIMKLTDVREVVTRHISDIMQMKLPDNQFEQIFPLINEIFNF